MKEIDLPDGSIAEFPDGMSDDQIAAVLRRQFGNPEAASTVSARSLALLTSSFLLRGLNRSTRGWSPALREARRMSLIRALTVWHGLRNK